MESFVATSPVPHLFDDIRLSFWAKQYKRAFDNAGLAFPKIFGDHRFLRRLLVTFAFKHLNVGTSECRLIATGRQFRFRNVNTQFHSVYFDRFRRVYEPEVASIICSLLQNNANFVDIGSNWGHYAALVTASTASHRYLNVTYTGIEPDSDSFADLKRFIEDSDVNEFVQTSIFQVAASNCAGDALLCNPPGFHSGLKYLGVGAVERNLVPVRRLDCLNVPNPTLVKVDVEGHEYEAIEGMAGILKSTPTIIFEHFRTHPFLATHTKSLSLLEGWGYRLYASLERSKVEPKADHFVCTTQFYRVTAASRYQFPEKINIAAFHKDCADLERVAATKLKEADDS